MYDSKIIYRKNLKAWRERMRRLGKKVCASNGCFDLLHVGHIEYLHESAKYGDVLIIGCNGDESVRQLNGDGRPIQKEQDRATILCALKSVDFVSVFREKEAIGFLKAVQPDFYIKGGDYTLESMSQKEKDAVTKNGGKIIIAPLLNGKSSSLLIDKINAETAKIYE
jgi:rfaE bifunctional protein nucleotidyltransferase chain/domain